MPTLIRRSGMKRWRASVMVSGKVRQKLFPDDTKDSYRAAVLWESQAKSELQQRETDMGSWSILDWANEYLDFAKQRFVKSTYEEKVRTMRRLLKAIPPATLVEDLTTPMALRFLQAEAKNRSGYAANKDRKNVVAAWNWARKYLGQFPAIQNPFLVVDRFAEERSPRYVPPESDFWAVYEVAEGQDKVILLTLLHLAARRGEIFRLKWADVSFHDSRIRLWTKKRTGGNRESDWLPMTSELKAALLGWWEDRLYKRSEYVFTQLDKGQTGGNFKGHRPGERFFFRAHFLPKLCEKAGVPRFGFHSIRHLTASILYHAGYPVSVIQSVLRHKSPQTTTMYLKSLGLEQTREALEGVMTKRGPAKVILLKKEPPEMAVSEG